MNKALFWVVWILELVLFLAGVGCVAVLMSISGGGRDGEFWLIVFLLLATVALGGFGLVKALQALNRQEKPGTVAAYLSLPVLAAFLFVGACFVQADTLVDALA